MIERRVIFEIHRMADSGFSIRRIANALHLDRQTVSKYLADPNPTRATVVKPSKLDPFKDQIHELLEKDREVSATVIHQRLKVQGFDGGLSILRDYLRKVRPKPKEAFIRFESQPGAQVQLDWGHFGSLSYGTTLRKLYVLAVIECHSRMLYLEFTHAQRQETLHRALLNAFRFFGGTPRELVHDNMLTAVTERDGPLVRFNDAFLDFLRPFHVVPIPCNVGQAHEKGKVEKGAIHYIRHNFWPLRNFADLLDVNQQFRHWLDTQANVRIHSTTGERPRDRFQPEALKPLPDFLPDCRETSSVKVQADFAIRFDGNSYSVPPWSVGKEVIVKADNQTVTSYLREKVLATHTRCWEKRQRIELPAHREAAWKRRPKEWLAVEVSRFLSFGEEAQGFLEGLNRTGQPIKKNLSKLLALHDRYGTQAWLQALQRATAYQAFAASYVENILHQKSHPKILQPPLKLIQREDLNRIRLEEPQLAEYDAWILKRKDPS